MSCPMPKKIKIGHGDYDVKHVSKKTNGSKVKDLGECDYVNQVITLFGNQAPSEISDSILHECLHGYIRNFNIPFKSLREEEKYVRQFTGMMITLFKDNPELMDYLKGQLHEP